MASMGLPVLRVLPLLSIRRPEDETTKSQWRAPHVQKAMKANVKFFREFYGKDYVDNTYF